MAPIAVSVLRDPGHLRRWLEEHHDRHADLWVDFYKKGTSQTGLVEVSHVNGFTPRKPRSTWSRVNIAKGEALIARGD